MPPIKSGIKQISEKSIIKSVKHDCGSVMVWCCVAPSELEPLSAII